MRILFTFEFPFAPGHYGGGHQIARGFARALARAGHEVHVLASGDDALGITAQDPGVRWHFTGEYDRRWSGVRLARRLPPVLDAVGPDLVCAYTSESPFVLREARRRGLPATVYLAAPELLPFRRLSSATLRLLRFNVGTFLQSVGAARASRVLTISRTIARQAVERWGVAPDAVRAIGTGVDEAYDAPLGAPRAALGPDGPRLLSVGRVVLQQKPLDRVAEALAMPGAPWREWTIVGAGPDEDRLRARLDALGIGDRVRLLGMRPPAEVVRLVDAHDLVLLPSTSESFFITAYEAASRGRVLITNDVAEVADYFAGEPSVTVLPDADPVGYRRALDAAVAEFGARERAAQVLAARVRGAFSWDAMAARLVAGVADLLLPAVPR